MTANVTIEIARKINVLRIPAAATRFRPTTEIFAALKQEPPADFGRGGFGGRGGRNAGGTQVAVAREDLRAAASRLAPRRRRRVELLPRR